MMGFCPLCICNTDECFIIVHLIVPLVTARGFPETPKFWLLIGTTIDHHPGIYKQQTIMCLAVQIHTGSGKGVGNWNLMLWRVYIEES